MCQPHLAAPGTLLTQPWLGPAWQERVDRPSGGGKGKKTGERCSREQALPVPPFAIELGPRFPGRLVINCCEE